MAAADEETAIDVAALDELEHAVGDDREFLRELVEAYLDDAPTQVEAMRDGLARTDIELLHRAAHTLKSNSASMGANALSEMCRQVEALTAAGQADTSDLAAPSLASRITDIGAELERVKAELDSLVPAEAT
ncbi:MAG: Hpt domain-containing protein [Chloroflexota bacterium]|nr:Hpt domain-containing protein [Chloroflexota bacterium]